MYQHKCILVSTNSRKPFLNSFTTTNRHTIT